MKQLHHMQVVQLSLNYKSNEHNIVFNSQPCFLIHIWLDIQTIIFQVSQTIILRSSTKSPLLNTLLQLSMGKEIKDPLTDLFGFNTIDNGAHYRRC